MPFGAARAGNPPALTSLRRTAAVESRPCPKYSQADRPMSVSSPLGSDVLLLQQFSGDEFVSRLFRFQLELLAESSTEIAFDKILGQSVTVTLRMPDGSPRHFNGIVNRFGQGEQVPSAMGSAFFTRYQAEIVPQLWLLTRKAQSRIFQQIAVPDILKQVFAGLDVAYQLQGDLPAPRLLRPVPRDRLRLRQPAHGGGGDLLLLHHTPTAATRWSSPTRPRATPTCPARGRPSTKRSRAGCATRTAIEAWEKTGDSLGQVHALGPLLRAARHKHLEAVSDPGLGRRRARSPTSSRSPATTSWSSTTTPAATPSGSTASTPGGGDRAGDIQKSSRTTAAPPASGCRRSAARRSLITGRSTCRHFTAGHKFTLERHFNADGDYVLTRRRALGHAWRDDYRSGSGRRRSSTRTRSPASPSALPFRPPRTTPEPVVQGTQTAVVVGPPGEEIFTDKYGRVKVQFHWDRQGKKDANSSCWIRVGDALGRQELGHRSTSRGSARRSSSTSSKATPTGRSIVGSVYNAEQMPPYDLPGNMTQSGIKSRSSQGGTPANFNEIRFEDKKGSEQVLLHAEKNQDIEVENDETHWVGHDRTKTIDHDETTHVKHDRTETVDNNETITIHGNRTETVDKDETITIHGNRTETVDKDETITIHGNRTETVDKDETITIPAAGPRTSPRTSPSPSAAAAPKTSAKDESITIGGGRTENVSKDERSPSAAAGPRASARTSDHDRRQRYGRSGKSDSLDRRQGR